MSNLDYLDKEIQKLRDLYYEWLGTPSASIREDKVGEYMATATSVLSGLISEFRAVSRESKR